MESHKSQEPVHRQTASKTCPCVAFAPMLNEHIISFRRFFYRKYIYKRRNMLRRAIFMMTTLCALPVMAQQTNETGYMAEISRADLADANGQRLDEIGAVLQRDRDNVHSGVAIDTGDEVDLWFKDATTRAEIAQMIDMLYIPEMTKRMILMGGTNVYVRVTDAAGPPRITSIELIP